MNKSLTWHDPVVAEIHAVRAELAREHGDDLLAYSNAAVAHCQRLNFQIGTAIGNAASAMPLPAEPPTTEA